MKIVINTTIGSSGLNLSNIGFQRYAELANITVYPQDRNTEDGEIWWWTVPFDERMQMPDGVEAWMDFSYNYCLSKDSAYKDFAKFMRKNTLNYMDIARDNDELIAVVDELGEKASNECILVVREIPDDVPWKIGFDNYFRREIIIAQWM